MVVEKFLLLQGLAIAAFGTAFVGTKAYRAIDFKPSFHVSGWLAFAGVLCAFILGGVGGSILGQQRDGSAFLAQGELRYAEGNYDSAIVAFNEAIQ
jgi:hypothetical protein